jgi:large subunit ribosomal protein L4
MVPQFAVTEPKTKNFVKLIGEITAEAKTLIVSGTFDDNTYRAARNVQPTLLMTAQEVNAEHLLLHRKIVITEDALAQLADRINKK